MVSGIFGGDIHELNLKASFPSIYKMEQEHGSIIKAFKNSSKEKTKTKPSLHSFTQGMKLLPKTLAVK